MIRSNFKSPSELRVMTFDNPSWQSIGKVLCQAN